MNAPANGCSCEYVVIALIPSISLHDGLSLFGCPHKQHKREGGWMEPARSFPCFVCIVRVVWYQEVRVLLLALLYFTVYICYTVGSTLAQTSFLRTVLYVDPTT